MSDVSIHLLLELSLRRRQRRAGIQSRRARCGAVHLQPAGMAAVHPVGHGRHRQAGALSLCAAGCYGRPKQGGRTVLPGWTDFLCIWAASGCFAPCRKIDSRQSAAAQAALTWGFVLLTRLRWGRCLYRKRGAADRLHHAFSLRLRAGARSGRLSAPYSSHGSRDSIPSVCCWLTRITMRDGFTQASPHAVSPLLRPSTGPKLRCRAAFYYGLIASRSAGRCRLETARELGSLLYDKAQPAPELSVFALDTASPAGLRMPPPCMRT